MHELAVFIFILCTASIAHAADLDTDAESFLSLDVFDQDIRDKAKHLMEEAEPLTKGDAPYIDYLAEILFDRRESLGSTKAKYERLHVTPDARYTKEVGEKEMELLLKLDKVIKFYEQEVLDKASPKVKEFFEKLEGMMEKPSDYLKWTEDQFVEAIKKLIEGMSEEDIQFTKAGIKEVMVKILLFLSFFIIMADLLNFG
ncbi:hypothetical protein WR25_24263 isoform E [Diploscapter pachys]|uniref:Fatty-acid and retinol-binding protein 1 n=2 Tax=Diploscapter pachys TaxID=2018661 RepID=A0A2A2LKA2_9BILA|nr:hypothetical protein WR25_24263 isoform E [Diploscapter pachys]